MWVLEHVTDCGFPLQVCKRVEREEEKLVLYLHGYEKTLRSYNVTCDHRTLWLCDDKLAIASRSFHLPTIHRWSYSRRAEKSPPHSVSCSLASQSLNNNKESLEIIVGPANFNHKELLSPTITTVEQHTTAQES